MGDAFGQYFCPIARGSEIFANRWTPIIIRNLILGAATFSEIRDGAPGLPRSVLTERLRYLEQVGVIERRDKESGRGSVYELTPTGRGLEPVVHALGDWGQEWIEAVPASIDPGGLLWAICKSMDRDRLPEPRVVVRVSFSDAPKQRFWLLVQSPDPEVCMKPPGFDEDMLLSCDSEALARWHMGELSLGQAMHAGRIEIEAPRHLVREFSEWGGVSPFAGVQPAPPN